MNILWKRCHAFNVCINLCKKGKTRTILFLQRTKVSAVIYSLNNLLFLSVKVFHLVSLRSSSCGAIILSIKLFHKTLLFYFCTVGPLIWLIFYKCYHSNLQYMPITAVLSLELFLSEWFQKTPLKKHIFMSNHEFYSFIYLICRHFITPVLYGRLFVGLQEDIYLFSIKFLFTLSVKCASTNDIPIFFFI